MNLNATLFIQSLVFVILGWITMKFIWPPLIKAMNERQSKIAEGLAAADKGEKSLAEAGPFALRRRGLEPPPGAPAAVTCAPAGG